MNRRHFLATSLATAHDLAHSKMKAMVETI